MKVDPVLCCLGRTLEIHIGETGYRFTTADKALLYSTPQGNKLWCISGIEVPTTKDQIQQRIAKHSAAVDKSVKLYQRWHEFDAAKGCIIKPPRGFLYKVGRCTAIKYASDKWSGRTNHYIHHFKKPPICWVNHKSAPRVVLLTGGAIRVRKDGIIG